MQQLSGGCHCGNIRIVLNLTHEPADYQPRACDCDFCRMHGAAYVSDPQGSLAVHVGDPQQRGSYQQGSGQADLVYCRRCGVLIGALYIDAGRCFATVNSRVITTTSTAGASIFGQDQPASPKGLTPEQKVGRWRNIWFSNVSIFTGPDA
jgi:hypothetical protein